jgi:hypothetical protein
MRCKWQEELRKNSFHLHSFGSLIKNKESNAFMIRIDNPAKDSFVKFVLKARTNTLPTKEFIEIMRGIPHTGCSACGKECNESLQHILNGCPAKRRLIIERHDSVVRYLRDTVQEKRREFSYAVTDATVREVDIQENRMLKPDVQLWNAERNKVILIEVNVPYAKTWEGRDSLEEKYELKREKYRDLTRELQARGVETEFYVVVVSSLGALYSESQKAIFQMLRGDKICRTVCRMVSSKAINGSAQIWRENRRRREPEQLNPAGEDPPDPNEERELPDTHEAEIEDVQKLLEETDSDLANIEEDSPVFDNLESDESETENEEEEAEVLTERELERLFTGEDETTHEPELLTEDSEPESEF